MMETLRDWKWTTCRMRAGDFKNDYYRYIQTACHQKTFLMVSETLCFSSEDEEPEKTKPNKGEDVPKG